MLPLSWAQQRLWFLGQLDAAASAAYHMPVALRLAGRLDLAALQRSLNRIVARHESLRTRFVNTDGAPVQVIDPADIGFALEQRDLSALDEVQRAQAVSELGAQEASQPFDLERGPLIRGILLRLADDEHVMLLTQHHIISDGWSIGVLVHEVSTLYAAFSQGLPDPLPALSVQYADYALWQRQWLQGELLETQLRFWKNHLAGAPELLDMPTDHPRPPVQTYRGSSVPVLLPAQLVESLRALSQQHQTTLFMTLLAGWAVLLSRLSGQNDVVIGTAVANRQHAEIEPLIGFFVNTLALRIKLDADPDVAQLLAQVRATTLEAYTHQELPFDQVVEAVKPPRNLGHAPLFQAMFAFESKHRQTSLSLPGLALSVLESQEYTAHFDLSLSLFDDAGTVNGKIEYASDLFERASIERLAGQFCLLLGEMAANSGKHSSELDLLSPPARQQLLVDFNASRTAFAETGLVHQLFEARAAASADAVAVEYEGEQLAYGELNRRANRLAHQLLALGVRPDDRVALCAQRSIGMVVALLGILKAGAAYVPLDPVYPKERLAYMLSDSAPVAVLTQPGLLGGAALPACPLLLLNEGGIETGSAGESTAEHNIDPASIGLTPDKLAYVIYTSGSTGLPKGVMLGHGGLGNLAQAQIGLFGVSAESRVLQFASFSFDASISEMMMALCSGAVLVLAPRDRLLPGTPLLATLAQSQITHVTLPSSALSAMAPEGIPARAMTLILAGDVLRPDVAGVWAEQHCLFNAYGPTEATVCATAYHWDGRFVHSVPIGRPIANVRCYLLDRHMQPVPVGVAGELWIGGAGVARGYLNRPDLTDERFVADPFSAGGRLYKTGDLGRYLADGNIEFLGRSDFQVKIRGFRIELGEIEARLAACAHVREAAVLAQAQAPDQPGQAGQQRLVAYVVPQEGVQLDAAQLRTELAQYLPEFMLPAAFVMLDAFPLTPNGKLDRKALPMPGQANVISRGYQMPEGETEQAIAAVWQSLLGLERVGRENHFFELGGHSLLIIAMIERLRVRGFNVNVRTVFASPVLRDLARAVESAHGVAEISVPANLIGADCTLLTPDLLPLVHLTQAEIDRIAAAVPGGTPNIQDIYPLGPLQEGILFHHLLDAGGDAYLSRSALAFDTRERLDQFLGALQKVIARHDILRSAVHWKDLAQSVQVVQRHASLPVVEVALSGAESALEQLFERTSAHHLRLDLGQAPLLAAFIGPDPAANEWLLLLAHHHMVCDHITLEIVIEEIGMLLNGQDALLPRPVPYRNFIAQSLQLPDAGHAAYFRRELGDIDEPTAPFGLLNVQHDGASIESVRLVLDDPLVQSIRLLAKQYGMTPAVLFHVAWAHVAGQCSGHDDVVFGTVLSGRLQGSQGADRALGMFINTLPIRIELAHAVSDVLRQTHRRLGELIEHEQASLALAQQCSGVQSPLPLFTTLFNYRHTGPKGQGEGAHVWAGVRLIVGEERTNYPLSVSVDDLGTGFAWEVQTVPGIDAAQVSAYLAQSVKGLVAALESTPQRLLGELTVLPPAERQRLLFDLNATGVHFPGDRLLHQLFEARAAAMPEAIAVEYDDEQLAYGELNRRANRLAHQLLALGVRPDDRVALCAQRSIGMVVALLGILKAGAAYVPLDPVYPKDRLAYMLSDSAPVAVLTQPGLLDGLTLPACPVLLIDDDSVSGQAEGGNQPNEHNIDPVGIGLSAGNLAYVIYTSGSTGLPKGAMVEHAGLHNLLDWYIDCCRFSAMDRVLVLTSFSFDLTQKNLWASLICGAQLHLARPEFDPHALGITIGTRKISAINLTPSTFYALIESEAQAALASLRWVILGGEPINTARIAPILERYPGLEILNSYGPTECTDVSAFHHLRRNLSSYHAEPPIGKPVSNVRLYVLDKRMQPVPVGVVGEIFVGGAGVGRGYLNRPELTAERFVRDPFAAEAGRRMYQTGDLGRYLADGDIEYLGRSDFQVKIRGFRIEPGEIEARLAACAQVREAVVLAREDLPGDKRLVAYVVAREGAQLLPSELRAELAQHLPEYMVPAAFVTLAALPLTPSGKLDRKALPAPAQADVMLRTFRPPEGEFEQTIASVWQSLLGLERVGRDDHFFELGGHSLLAVRLVSRVRQVFGVELALRDLFVDATVAGMAALVARAKRSTLPAIVAAPRGGALPLSWAQQRLWFISQLDAAASAAYHMPVALRLAGRLDLAALQRSLNRIVARHESLRTRFVNADGAPVQVIDPAEIGFSLQQRDLSALDAEPRAQAVNELGAQEASRPFDLEYGPLIRGVLLRLADDEHVMLLTQHHIISDGWSVGVLVHEVSTLYAAFSQSLPDPLPALGVQYADYALWQRKWLRGALLENQLQFWKDHLAGAPELLDMPTDRPRPPVQSYRGSNVPVLLPAQLVESLRALSQQHQTTLFMTLLAGWAVLLSRLSGQNDVVIGTAVANRQHAEIEPLIGFFVNTLALRIKLDTDPDVAQLLAQVRAMTLDAYTHQELPFDQVVEAVKPARNLGHAPLFQTMFSMDNTAGSGERQLPGLVLTPFEVPHATTQFDLGLMLNQEGSVIGGDLAYASDLFDRQTIERLAEQFRVLLGDMVANGGKRASELDLLSASARQQLLFELNATQTHFPGSQFVHQLFEAQAAAMPEAVAVEYEGEQLAYGELNRRANRLAHQLLAMGVRPDERVALCAARSIGMVVALLGILKAGAAYVPLDPVYPKDRLAYMLSDSAPVAVLTQPGLLDGVALPACPLLLLDEGVSEFENPGENAAQHNMNPASPGLTPDKLAYVIYTSGSTGLPKGVMVEHRGFVNYLQWACRYYCSVKSRDSIVSSSLAFDATVTSMFVPLLCGGTVHLIRERDEIEGLEKLLSQDRHWGIIKITPSHLDLLGHRLRDKQRSHIGHIVVGGEALPAATVSMWHALNPDGTVINEYGPTETVVGCVVYDTRSMGPEQTVIPVGRPIANTRIYILDANMQPVPVGVAGELWIGGAGVARGYLNRPDLTDERFVADPFAADGGRLYKTGDLGRYLADGNIEFLGRSDFQVKIRGFRIELGEIEARLAACAQVREAAVLAQAPDQPGGQRLVAYVVPQEGAQLDAAQLRTELAQNLPEFMLPAAFVMLDAFPLTPNGKLDRKALPMPGQADVISRGYQMPEGETEQAIAAVWQSLLGLERVGREDHFFELGGHSLLIIAMIERLRVRGFNVNVRTVFASPVLRDLARAVESAHGVAEISVPANLIGADCTLLTPDLLPLVHLTQAEIDRIAAAVPGGTPNIQDIYPLGPLQEGILFHHLLDAGGDAYLSRSALAFDTRERLDQFLAALQKVIARHDILRSAVHWKDLAQSVQVVQRHASLPVVEVALSGAESALEQLFERTSAHHLRLDLGQAPLLAAFIGLDPAANEWLLLLAHHHMVCDHITLEIVIEEIGMLLNGQDALLPRPVPYRNFIAQSLQLPDAGHAAYFRRELGDIDEPTAPFGLLNVQHDGASIESVRLVLDDPLVQSIRLLAKQYGMTPAVLFHVAWAHVAGQCSGHDDVVFGTVLSGRLQGSQGADRALGMFINTLPIRIDLAHAVSDVLRQTHRRLGELIEHEQASLALAQQCSGVQSPLPLFTSLLNYRHTGPKGQGEDAHTWAGVRLIVGEERTNYPLSVSVDDLGTGFAWEVQSVPGIDATQVSAYLAQSVKGLVAALESTPQRLLGELTILPPAERQRLLFDLNATEVHFPGDRLLHQLFEARAAAMPEAIAVEYDDEQLAYGELNRRANRLAHQLLALGVRPDDRVALCAARSIGMVVALLGILKAGAAYVPLDPVYPKDRLAYMLSDSAPVAILTQPGLLDGLTLPACPVLLMDGDSAFGQAEGGNQPNEHNIDPVGIGLSAGNLAYVLYTSGSTGLPKGVMVEHGNVVNLVRGYIRSNSMTESDRVLQFASLSFDNSIAEIFPALSVGATLVLRDASLLIPEAGFIAFLHSRKISVADLPTAFWHLWAQQVGEGRNLPPPSLRLVAAGGEKAEIRYLTQWLQGSTSAKCRWLNTYGPTEATVNATSIAYDKDSILPHQAIPIGRPVANAQIHILNRHMEPVPVGVPGEIWIGGAGVARGYLNRPELTAERFVRNPFSSGGGRLYWTGDLGRYLPDGNIEYFGRSDFQVKIRGFRIELGEIEARLAACAQVREAVVLAREDQPGDKRLVAYVVAREGAQLLPSELRAELAQHLPEYMVPAAFVSLAVLPLTPSGKLDRKALPAPGQADVMLRTFRAPEGEFEQTIASVWQSLLGLEQVGRDDNFFELGGHSLLAVRLVSRVRQLFGVELALRDVFVDATVPGMAALVARAKRSTLPAIVAAPRDGALPLSWAQQRLWFLSQLDAAAGAAYHMPVALRLAGRLDLPALQRSLNRIVARHESLRTRFVNADGVPVQVIDPADIGFALEQRDFSALAPELKSKAVSELGAQEASQPFDLERGPLIRGILLRLADDEHVMLLTQHHIITDGWSVGVLVQEVSTLYAAFSQGLPDPLPALSVQYADYALWQRQWLQGALLENQLQFWKNHLAGAPELLDMPTDHPRPPIQSYRGSSVPVLLPAELVEGLRNLSQQHQTTLFMTLLAGWAVLLSRLSGQNDVVIGTAVANRQHAEIEPLIGFFVNTLALRIKLDADPDVAQLLAQVRATTLDAYTHQELPFDQVVEALKPARNLGHAPLFQAMFAFEAKTGQASLSLPGLALSLLETPEYSAHFDLSLSLTENAGMVGGELEYASDLFERSTMERLTEQFGVLLGEMVANSEKRSSELNLLSPPVRQQLLVDFNASRTAFAEAGLVHQLFEARAAARADAVAVEYEGEQLAYGELNRRANRLAHQLLAMGVRPDDRVALCARRSIGMVVALLGILKAGAAYVPLDPVYPKERLAYMLSDSAPVAVLSQPGLLDGAALPACPLLLLDEGGIETGSAGDPTAEHNIDPASIGLTPDKLAYVIYTSGSTGLPKGVMAGHGGLGNLAQAQIGLFGVSATSRVLQFASFSFDASISEIMMALCSGAVLVLAPRERLLPGTPLLSTLEQAQITHVTLPSSALSALTPEGVPARRMTLILAGDVLRPDVAGVWAEQHHLFNAYGPTEATVCATAYRWDGRIVHSVPIGKPIANVRCYLLDRHSQPVPVGVAGELWIGGAGVARGYLNRPDLTDERFVADPFDADGGRLYNTGDLGRYLPDGNIEFLGRSDFQVKIRGFRIELGEIEARLAACAKVREAAVLAHQAAAAGDQRLVAYVVPQDGASLVAAELRTELAQYLPEFMLPAAFVMLDAFPLTPNGKLDRKALPMPGKLDVISRGYQAPVGDLELAIATIWGELLGIDEVGRFDNFFDLGGNSLLILRFLSLIRVATGIEFRVHDIYLHSTPAALATIAARQNQSASAPLVHPVRTEGASTPLFLIHAGGGDIDYVRLLAPRIAHDIPVYGLRALGLEKGEIPLRSIAEMAALHIQEIRTVQPVGPYRIGGFSAGGIIAHEIACQLARDGERIEYLGLIDANRDLNLLLGHDEYGFTELDALQLMLPTGIPEADRKELQDLAGTGDAAIMLAHCQRIGLIPLDVDMATIMRHLQFRRALIVAASAYDAPPVNIQAHLYMTTDDGNDSSRFGWDGIFEKIVVTAVAGNHLSLMTMPYLDELGKCIARDINHLDCIKNMESIV